MNQVYGIIRKLLMQFSLALIITVPFNEGKKTRNVSQLNQLLQLHLMDSNAEKYKISIIGADTLKSQI